WGDLADFTLALAAAHELQVVGWTIDTHDWRGDPADQMLAAISLEAGGIVLAHDGVGSGARRATADTTAELIPPLLERARHQGLTPGRLHFDWPVPLPLGNPAFG